MTEKQAIERLKCMKLFMQINDKDNESKFLDEDYEANAMAIEALEKQIPQKVIRKDIREYARFYCPNNHFMFEEHCKIFDLNKHDFSKSGYCECCGQKLDWSEWE